MIRCALFNEEQAALTMGGAELIDQFDFARDWLWIDMDGEDGRAAEAMLERFEIHPLAIQDALRTRHPPKIEDFDNFLFILYRGLDATTTGIDFGVIQLGLFVTSRVFISHHTKPSVSSNWLYEQLEANPDWMAGGPSHLAVKLSNRLVRRYVEILLDLEPRLDAVEEEMFDQPNDQLLAELTGYKTRLRHIARISGYHEHVARELAKGNPLMDPALSHEITDLFEQVERSSSLAALYYQTATDLIESYLALSSHRLNRVMQILTVITVIFVPLTFLAGIYGMNFENMPELSSPLGYFIVIGIMFTAALTQYIYFRRRGWV